MDEIFGSICLKKKDSFHLNCIEEKKELEEVVASPGLRSLNAKKPHRKTDFAKQNFQVNLSVTTKKHKKRDSNQMTKSMLPTTSNPIKSFSTNEKGKSPMLKKEAYRQKTHVRHPSLTYSKRDKYISNFDGKSTLLSKIIRPAESNDASLIYLENNFGKLDKQLISRSPEVKHKYSGFKKANSNKPSFAERCRKSLKKEDDNTELCVTIHKVSMLNESEENNELSRKLTSSEDEREGENNGNLEPGSNIFDVEFEEKERRIYEFLESENVEFVLVDQREKYNQKLRFKKLINQSKVKPMSPLMQRRQNLRAGTSPWLSSLSLRSCMSTDNLENVLDVKLDIN